MSETTHIQPCERVDQWLDVLARYAIDSEDSDVRRDDARYEVLADAVISYLPRFAEEHEQPVALFGKVFELSNRGITLRTQNQIPGDAQVEVQLMFEEGPVAVRGRAIHCTGTVGAFKIGVKLLLESTEHEETEQPEEHVPDAKSPYAGWTGTPAYNIIEMPQMDPALIGYTPPTPSEVSSTASGNEPDFWTRHQKKVSGTIETVFCIGFISSVSVVVGRIILTAVQRS